MERGGIDYSLAIVRAVPLERNPEAEKSESEKALGDYTVRAKDRTGIGKRLSDQTMRSHLTAIKAFLPCLSKQALASLEGIGKEGGKVDQMMKGKKSGDRQSLPFLPGEFRGVAVREFQVAKKPLKLTAAYCETLRHSLRQMARSLDDDVHKAAVQRGHDGKAGLDVTSQMLGGYLTGDRPKRVDHIVSNDGRLSRMDSCEARDGLIIQLFISNGKRSGDLANLERQEVESAQIDPSSPTELQIYDHKEARSRKMCPLLVNPSLLRAMKTYMAKESISRGSKLLFTTDQGKLLSSTTMTKVVKREWKRHGDGIGQVLPSLTATVCRKVAVSTLRESDGDRNEQRVLAMHMAHNPMTADKYYDRSERKMERVGVWEKLNKTYKGSSNEQRVLAMHMAHNPMTADKYYDRSERKMERVGVWEKLNKTYKGSSKLQDAEQQPTPDLSPPVLEPASSDSDGVRPPSPTHHERRKTTPKLISTAAIHHT